jgi:hypothetical protein
MSARLRSTPWHQAAAAAEQRFRELANDPGLAYAFWILARITWAARDESFLGELSWLGVRDFPSETALGLISGTINHVREHLSELSGRSDFSEIATLAVARSLQETIGRQGSSLFDSAAEGARRAFREYSSPAKFSELAKIFFADFMARSLRSFVDREVSNHVGPGKPIGSVADSKSFLDALDLHTRQAARIVEEFSQGWYSLHQWESSGDIGLDEAQRFVGQALRKLRAELKQGAAAG